MPVTPDELFAYLDSLGIAHTTVRHQPLFTVEESQSLRGMIPGGHTKNLFLKDKKSALYLVTALEDAAIELKSLHRLLGAINDTAGRITVVLDAGLMAHETINAHPLINTMTTSISRDDLLKFLREIGRAHV